uniref:Coiled-coil domain containing 154 n=1 Tax=Nomascus leucogenys TaxID=61853 RepID=G1RBF1_NOMLE
LAEPAHSGPSGASAPSQLSTVTLEDLGLVLAGGLASLEPLSLEELSERYESSHPTSTASVPEQDTAKHWNQLEQWVVEVACLREHKQRCERATRSLLRELLQVRGPRAAAGLRAERSRRRGPAAQAPKKEFSGLQNQMQALDKRLVEVRESLTHLRRRQAQQEAEGRGAEQEAGLRLAKLTDLLQQGREVACGALVDLEVARMQAQVTKLGEEVSLRFLKREAKLCGFLQKSFLALEKRMKASESSRLRLEGSLRGELESRWEKLRRLMEERLRALQGQHEVGLGRQRAGGESHLLEQCQGLDAAVAQLTKFVQQNQASLNCVLLAEEKAWDAKGRLEESGAGELAACVQENLEAAQLAGELARQEMHGELALLREKSQALEAWVAQLARQLKDSRFHLQKQMLCLRLSEVRQAAGARQASAQHLQPLRPKVEPQPTIESVSDKCLLHKSDSDLRISAEGKARESEVGAMRQELATLLSSVQLLKEDSPGRKIAEMQGKLTTNQIMKLENCVQANKTIQNLRFNTAARLRTQEMAALRESVLRLRSEEGPRMPLGSWKALPSLARPRVFIKDTAPGKVVPVNCWGVHQAVRWLRWKASLIKLRAPRRPGGVPEKPHSQEQMPLLTPSLFIQK